MSMTAVLDREPDVIVEVASAPTLTAPQNCPHNTGTYRVPIGDGTTGHNRCNQCHMILSTT